MSNLPATRGKFGQHEYFAVTMKAKELTERFITPSEVPGWDDLTIDQRWQREIQYTRVKNHIAPYLVKNENRFFGAFICIIHNADDDLWIPFSDVADFKHKGSKQLLDFDLDNIGFLKLKGGEAIIPIDGQHRYAALKMAITGEDHNHKELPCGGNLDLLDDDCMVIILKNDEPEKTRNIFNKVNRYAKPTSPTENLMTSDDDPYAICTRHICGIITDKLVKFTSTLSANDFEFTTLPIINSINSEILAARFPDEKIKKDEKPSSEKMALYIDACEDFWNLFITEIDVWKKALDDPNNEKGIGDERRSDMRAGYLILKPVIKHALCKAFFRVTTLKPGQTSSLSDKEVIKRINEIDWMYSNHLWKGVLFTEGNKIIAKGGVNLASRVIAYHLGEKLSKDELKNLNDDFLKNIGRKLEDPLN